VGGGRLRGGKAMDGSVGCGMQRWRCCGIQLGM